MQSALSIKRIYISTGSQVTLKALQGAKVTANVFILNVKVTFLLHDFVVLPFDATFGLLQSK